MRFKALRRKGQTSTFARILYIDGTLEIAEGDIPYLQPQTANMDLMIRSSGLAREFEIPQFVEDYELVEVEVTIIEPEK